MRDLYRETAEHDNAGAKIKRKGAVETRHQKDKREKKERAATEYRQTVALTREVGSRILDGVFDDQGEEHSFCAEHVEGIGIVRSKDPNDYIRRAIRMSEERRAFQRYKPNGKANGHGFYKHGAISMVTTVAPWQVPIFKLLPQSERDLLMLELARVEAKVIKEQTGRQVYGLGLHYDAACPHRHLHIPKTDENGNIHPSKGDSPFVFLTVGPATVGWDRIARAFGEDSGLIEPDSLDHYHTNLAKKYSPEDGSEPRKLIDIECARACDQAFFEFVTRNHLVQEYDKAKKAYSAKKLRALKTDRYRPLMKASLDEFVRSREWFLAREQMKMAMWRLLPKEWRLPIQLTIRCTQLIRNPMGFTINQAKRLLLEKRIKEMPPIEKVSLKII